MKLSRSTLLKAALAGLVVASSSAFAVDNSKTATTAMNGKCVGSNSCKAKSDCHSKDNSCAGKNSCKGKGWNKMSKEDCSKAHGKFEELKDEMPST